MIISKRKNLHQIQVKIDEEPLEKCDSYKYLGVFIDKELNWKPHIEYISTKISKVCVCRA